MCTNLWNTAEHCSPVPGSLNSSHDIEGVLTECETNNSFNMQSQSGCRGKDMKRQLWLSPSQSLWQECEEITGLLEKMKRFKSEVTLDITVCLCGILISTLSSWLSASVLYTEQWLRPDIQYPSTDEENVLTAVKSPLSQLQLPSVGLSVTAASTEDVISGGPVKLNEQVRTTYSTPSPLRKST